MKICFVGLEIIPIKSGVVLGGISNVVQLSKELSSRGHRILVLTSDVNRVCHGILSEPWGQIHPHPVHGQYTSVRSSAEFLIKVIHSIVREYHQERFDILHFHSSYPAFGLISLLSRAVVRAPKVFTLNSPIQPKPLRDRKGIYQRLSSPFWARLFLSGVKLIAINQNVKRSLISTGFNKSAISLLPPAIDTARFNAHLDSTLKREELKVNKETPLILYCGNWAKWKGIDILLESMVSVVRELPGARLITAWGEAYDWYDKRRKAISQKIQALHLEKNIIELDIIPDMERLMAASNVFVAPFLNTDGVVDSPVSILEAMSCATPVIATRVGGIPEIVNHKQNGLLVPPGNPSELASAILYLLKNKGESRRMGAKGAELVSQRFSVEMVVDRLEEIYQEMIKG